MKLIVKPLSSSGSLAHSSMVLRLNNDEKFADIADIIAQFLAVNPENIQLLIQSRRPKPNETLKTIAYGVEVLRCHAKIHTLPQCVIPHSDEFLFLAAVFQKAKSRLSFSWENFILIYQENLHLLNVQIKNAIIKTDMHAEEIALLNSMVDEFYDLYIIDENKLKQFIADHQKGFSWMLANFQDDIFMEENQIFKTFLQQWVNLIVQHVNWLDFAADRNASRMPATNISGEQIALFSNIKKKINRISTKTLE